MKQIQLTQGQFALVDDEDYEALAKYKWYARWNQSSKTYYAQRMAPKAEGRREIVIMHRQLLAAGAEQEVDHRNHNGLDNRRENLRLCSVGENCRNRRRRSDSKNRFKGVRPVGGRWSARIQGPRVNGVAPRMHLGMFDTEIEAARAYNRVARELFGEFALLNDVKAEAS